MKNTFRAILAGLVVTSIGVAGTTPSIDLNQNIDNYASTPRLTYTDAKVVVDNDEALQTKIQIIRGAQKSIDMMYYIFAQDESASFFTNEVIKAAGRGVKVRLLVDIFSNFMNLDLFNAIQSDTRAKGNIQISFYGRPSENIVRDSIYMTMPCPEAMKTKCDATDKACQSANDLACDKEKIITTNAAVDQARAQGADMKTWAPKIPINGLQAGAQEFLSGLYSKNLNYASAIMGITQAIDQQALAQWKGSFTPAQAAKLKKFTKMFIDYKKGKSAGVSLYFSSKDQETTDLLEDVINKFDRYIPEQNAIGTVAPNVGKPVAINLKDSSGNPIPNRNEDAAQQDWNFVTDYLHHKIIIADDNGGPNYRIMVGGRNIENSYHMSINPAKYVFMDTEITAKLDNSSGQSVLTAYGLLFNYDTQVMPLQTANSFLPNDGMASFSAGEQHCQQEIGPKKIALATSLKLRIEPIIKNDKQVGIKYFDPNTGLRLTSKQETAAGLTPSNIESMTCMFTYLLNPANLSRQSDRVAVKAKQIASNAAKYESDFVNYHSSPDPIQSAANPILSPAYKAAKEANNIVKKNLTAIGKKDGRFEVADGQVMAYLENLPFARWKGIRDSHGKLVSETKKAASELPGPRNYGSKYGREELSGKGIHKLWANELLNACNGTDVNHPKRIILHSAYFFPSSNLLRALAKLAHVFPDASARDEQNNPPLGDCSNVKVQIITNSLLSTDLTPVNVYNNYAMFGLFQAITKSKNNGGAQIEFYEYANAPSSIQLGNNKPFDQVFSLHTKTSLIGDDVIVGSANGDDRSYFQDTNNAIIVRGDSSFANEYRGYIDNLIKDAKVSRIDNANPADPRVIDGGWRTETAVQLRDKSRTALRHNKFVENYIKSKTDRFAEETGSNTTLYNQEVTALNNNINAKIEKVLNQLEDTRVQSEEMMVDIGSPSLDDMMNKPVYRELTGTDEQKMQSLIDSKNKYDMNGKGI